MPDTACFDADVIIDRQRRVPWRGTPQRLKSADVLRRLGGVACLLPLGKMISSYIYIFRAYANLRRARTEVHKTFTQELRSERGNAEIKVFHEPL